MEAEDVEGLVPLLSALFHVPLPEKDENFGFDDSLALPHWNNERLRPRNLLDCIEYSRIMAGKQSISALARIV